MGAARSRTTIVARPPRQSGQARKLVSEYRIEEPCVSGYNTWGPAWREHQARQHQNADPDPEALRQARRPIPELDARAALRTTTGRTAYFELFTKDTDERLIERRG
jgi:hypothetical protein